MTAIVAVGSTATVAAAAPVPLRAAEAFAVLSGSAVTNTGPSTITGDLGVSPGSSVTGFPPGTVTSGSIHLADTAAQEAQVALTTAFTDAAGRPAGATISANLGGTTLAPGVYRSGSTIDLTGDLVLDGKGDANAEWIFQAGSAVTVTSGSRVLLVGGAQACNVVWQVGSSATIGTNASFVGNILAQASVTLATNAQLDGRALARTAEVTLQSNRVTRTACAAGTRPNSGVGTSAPPTGSAAPGVDPAGSSIRLNGPRGCVGPRFTIGVSGRGIDRVDFSVAGRNIARVDRRDASGSFRTRLTAPPGAQSIAVAARVRTAAGRVRTLRTTVRRCVRSTVRLPRFTG